MLNIDVIGYGYWGRNIVRNLMAIKEAKLTRVSDLISENLEKVKNVYPTIKLSQNYLESINSKDVEAIAIITPLSTHYKLAKEALENGKHVFVEKPFTSTEKEAQELVELADKKGLKIMVDHTFIFTGAIRKMKDIIDQNVLGDLFYYDSTRVSLGLFQQDTNVIWDLAPHDFSIIDFLTKNKPLSLTAQGADHMERGHENIAYITINYENNLIVHINVNWLSPVKVRTILIGGQKKMLVYDDMEADEKIKIYDKGVDVGTAEGINQLKVEYRSGDMWSPRVNHVEALKSELEYFIHCITNDETPVNDGHSGLRVVRMLELADKSLKNGGRLIKL